MSPSPSRSRTRSLARSLGGVALLLALAWPYLAFVPYAPMVLDTPVWYANADPFEEGWLEWVFGSRHFVVGYRPVSALTYTVTLALGLESTWVPRILDVALHVAAAWLLARLFWTLAPGLPRWGGWTAAAVYAAHPAGQEVVPFLSRRSYTLAAVFTLLGLLVACRSARAGGGWRRRVGPSFGAGALLALGLLSHEVAIFAIGALPFLVAACEAPGADRPRRVAAWLVGPLLLVGAALGARFLVVEGIGGYRLDESEEAGAAGVLREMGRGLTGLSFGRGPDGAGDTWILALLLLLLAASLGAVGLRLARRGDRSLLPLGAALLLWLLAPAPVFAAQGVWFRRQMHPATLPLALLLGLILVATVARLRGRARVVLLVGPLAVLGAIGLRSPLVRGPDPVLLERWDRRQEVVEGLLEALDRVELPARVVVVLPNQGQGSGGGDRKLHEPDPRERVARGSRMPVEWARVARRLDGLDITEYYVDEEDWERATPFEIVARGVPRGVRLPPGVEILRPSGRPAPHFSADEPREWMLGRATRHKKLYFFFHDGEGGRLVEQEHGGQRIDGPGF